MKLLKLPKKQNQEPSQSYALQRRHILGKSSSFAVQEAYKTLRTNVRFFLSGEGCKKFAITSGLASEGKSITMLNLAISFAQTGAKVLLIDGDLRRPCLARLLIEKASPGLSNILAGLIHEDEAIRKDVYPNLDVILSGEIPPNPSELLGNDRMKQLIDNMSKRYDYILVDAPPVGVVSDVCVLAEQMQGVLFLVRQNITEKDAVTRGLRQLEISGAKLMGFVLNGVIPAGSRYRYKRYYYYRKYKYKYSYEASKNK